MESNKLRKQCLPSSNFYHKEMDLLLLYSTTFASFWQGTLREGLGGGVPPIKTLHNRSVDLFKPEFAQ